MITFNNGSYIQPINPTYKVKNNVTRSERSEYITYYCPNCMKTHYILITESYFIKGQWYCKESVDRMSI